jgi:hypothetical protein
MHDIAVQCAGVYCVSMHGMDVPGGKKTIYNANSRKKFSYYMSLNKFCRFKEEA